MQSSASGNASRPTIRILEIEPDLARYLEPSERSLARSVSAPVVTVKKGDADLDQLLEDSGAFAAIVLDGMLVQGVRVGDQLTLRLLGPGDFVSVPAPQPSMLAAETSRRAVADTRLALLGDEMLRAVGRWPQLLVGLQTRAGEQGERLAAQLAICHMPRVTDRLLAMLWLLAESWGRVTRVGTTLPLDLTHDTLGSLVGARRPTVTIALGELSDRGAIVRQEHGWLLLEAPVRPTRRAPDVEMPRFRSAHGSEWDDPGETPDVDPERARAQLLDTVVRLRAEHIVSREAIREQLAAMARSRERSEEIRLRISRRRLPPS